MKRTRVQAGFKTSRQHRKRLRQQRMVASPIYGLSPGSPRELKYIDTSMGGTSYPLAGTGVLLLLNGSTQGSDATNRIGRKINIRSIQIRCAVTLANTGVSNGLLFRTIIFVDKQANAAAPAVTDYLLTDSFSANHNLNNRDRFVTLMDKIHPNGASGDVYNIAWKKYIRCNMETIYNSGNAGTIADIQSGSLYMLTYMCAGALTTTESVTLGRIRVRFEDA